MQKHFPLSVLVFIDSLVVSASQDAGGHTLSRQNNLTFGIGLHVVGARTIVYATPYTNFLGWIVYQIFLPMVRKSPYLTGFKKELKTYLFRQFLESGSLFL